MVAFLKLYTRMRKHYRADLQSIGLLFYADINVRGVLFIFCKQEHLYCTFKIIRKKIDNNNNNNIYL